MASLRSTVDGLGGEEIGQPGSQVSDMWLTGSVISESMISGANVYATATVQGEDVFGDTTVSGATVKGTTVNNTDGELQSVAVGSPSSVFGAYVQAGSGVLDSSSGLWLVYPTAFTGQPTVLVTNASTISKTINAGSIGTGSFNAYGEAASDNFSWIAIGL